MDELQALRELRGDAAPAPPQRMAALRAGLFQSIASPPRRPVPKLVWRLGLAGALAVTMLAGVTVAQGNGPFRPDAASAAVFLEQAAAELSTQPSRQVRPRDDQWLYTRELSSNLTVTSTVGSKDDPKEEDTRRVDVKESETWFRFDGKEIAGVGADGSVRRNPIDLTGYDERYPAQVWDLHASLPLDPDDLLAMVHAEVKRIYPDDPQFHHGQGLNNRTVWLIGVLLGEDTGLVPSPEQQAALYRALAKVPGVTITNDVTDLSGRDGVLLQHRWRDFRFGLVIDPDSYALLGTAHQLEGKKVVEGSALLESGIVDKPGERP